MKELTGLCGLVPLNPRIFAVVETCKMIGDNFKRLALFADADNVAGFNLIGSDVHYSAIDCDVAVQNELTGSCTCRGNAQTVYNVVKTAFEKLKQNFTGDTLHRTCTLEKVAELLFKYAVGVLGFLLLTQLNAIFRRFAALVLAVLAGGVVAALEGLVLSEDGLAELACYFGLGTYVSCHFV